MANGPVQDRIAGALQAVDKMLSGVDLGKIPFGLKEDLAYVDRFLGLSQRGKSLATYAPRTRRRYVAAAKRGDSGASQTLKRERTMRTSNTKAKWGLTATQLSKLNRYRIPIMESGVDINEFLDPDIIKDTVTMYGFDYMYEVLEQQYDSIQQYTRGNKTPGNQRWNSRGELEEHAKNNMGQAFAAALHYRAKGTDPYYYYHGTIR